CNDPLTLGSLRALIARGPGASFGAECCVSFLNAGVLPVRGPEGVLEQQEILKMLKKMIVGAAALGAMMSASIAGEWADACVATLEAEGRDASGCACLEEEIIANDLVDEFAELGEIADPAARYEAASDAAKTAMNKCTR
ncbi:MAG: hypothetical protein AAFW68_09775, partial [Pseudomonadota bacterium]